MSRSSSVPLYTNALPGSPFDGQEVYVPSGIAGITWHLRYNASAAGSYKWEFVGGPDVVLQGHTGRALTNQLTFASLPVDPLSFTLPFSGDYEIAVETFPSLGAAGGARYSFSTDAGGTNAGVGFSASFAAGAAGNGASIRASSLLTGLTAGNPIIEKACTLGNYTVTFFNRRLIVRPVRLG